MKGKLKLIIGSQNRVKIDAVKEIIHDYPHLRDAKITGVKVQSGVGVQPRSLEETVRGAMNRARNAFRNCDYSFGIESGLIAVPGTKTGFMDVSICAIFDGKEYHLGLSSAWEAPKKVAHYILKEGLDMNEAARKAGLTRKRKIGSEMGLIGIITKGRLTRKEYTKEAIRTALIHIDHEIYR